MNKVEPKTVDVTEIVEQETFGVGMTKSREDFTAITKLPLEEIFKELTNGWTLLPDSDEVRPIWMCLQNKNYTAVERVFLFSRALVDHMPVHAAMELDGRLEHAVVYCSRDDYPDTEFSFMAADNRLANYTNTAANIYVHKHDTLPKTIYIGCPPEHLSIISLDAFEQEIRKTLKFELK